MKENNMFKKILFTIEIIFYIILSLILSIRTSPLGLAYGFDSSSFRYIGYTIANGYLPYLHTFDHKPPGVFFIAAITNWMGEWGYWIGFYILFIVSILILYKILQNDKYRIFLIISFIFLAKIDYFIIEESGMTRELVLYLLVYLYSSLYWKKYILSGVLLGCIFQTQTNAVAGAFLFSCMFLYSQNFFIKLRSFIYGFFGINLILLSYLILGGAFKEYINQAYLFNFLYYTKASDAAQSIYGGFKLIIDHINMSGLSSFYSFILALNIFLFLFIKKVRLQALCLILILMCEFVILSIGTRAFPHYLIYIQFFIWYSLYLFFHSPVIANIKLDKIVKHTTFLILILLIFPVIKQKHVLTAEIIDNYPSVGVRYKTYYPRWSDDVKDMKDCANQLFVFNNPQATKVNVDLNIKSPVSFVYFHFMNDGIGVHNKLENYFLIYPQIIKDLDNYKTKYVVDYSHENMFFAKEWKDYLYKNYKPLSTGYDLNWKGEVDKKWDLYVRKAL